VVVGRGEKGRDEQEIEGWKRRREEERKKKKQSLSSLVPSEGSGMDKRRNRGGKEWRREWGKGIGFPQDGQVEGGFRGGRGGEGAPK
jgi:hypothetical protein